VVFSVMDGAKEVAQIHLYMAIISFMAYAQNDYPLTLMNEKLGCG